MKKKNIVIALIAAGAAQLSSAQPYSKIVAFGDSLTDSGAFPDTGVTINFAGNPVPAAGLRVTNRVGPTFLPPEPTGKVAIQWVAQDLGLGELNPATQSRVPGQPFTVSLFNGQEEGTNYAIARNTTSMILSSIQDPLGSVLVNSGVTLNATNGYLVDNPSADPDALFYISGGANDVLALATSGVTDPATIGATATQAMGRIVTGANALDAAGANYIMVANVPDIGSTPLAFGLANTTPGADVGLTTVAGAFNSVLYQGINGSSANIIPFDLYGLLAEVASDPSRYGFSTFSATGSATTTCFVGGGSAPCLEDPAYGLSSGAPNPDQLIFADGIHPTTAAQRAIADYQLAILNAPSEMALLPQMGLQSVESDMRRVSNSLNATKHVDTFGKLQVNLSLDASSNELSNDLYNIGLDGDSTTFAIDALKELGDYWKLGGSISLTNAEYKGLQTNSFYELENIGFNLVAAYHHGRYEADLVLNSTTLRYGTVTRHTPVGGDVNRVEEADTEGTALAAQATAAYDLSFEGDAFAFGPKLIVGTSTVTVDAFSDYSGSITALNFLEQDVDANYVQPSVFAAFNNDDKTIAFSATVGIRSALGHDYDDIGAQLQSLEGQVTRSFTLPSYDVADRESVVSELNFTYTPTPNARLSVQYRGDSADNGYDTVGIHGVYNF